MAVETDKLTSIWQFQAMTISSTQLQIAAVQDLKRTPIFLEPNHQYVAHGTKEEAVLLRDALNATNYQLDLSEMAALCSQLGDGLQAPLNLITK